MKIKVALLTTLQAAIKWNGSVYNKLQLKSSKQAKASVTLAWKKPSGTKKVVIYGNKRGKANKMKKIATALGVSLKSLFEQVDDVEGFIRIHGKVYQFNSRQELDSLLTENNSRSC